MSKTLKIYIALLLLLFLGAFAIELSKPKPIDWTPTYNELHKKPFGTYILYKELSKLMDDQEVEPVKVSPYEFFDGFYSYQDSSYSKSGSFLYINDFMDIDDISLDELLYYTEQGNDVFISSTYPSKYLRDTLHFETQNDYNFKGKALLSFANKRLKSNSITIERGLSNIYFSKIDTANAVVLGYQKFDTINRVNFIKMQHGEGHLYLHLQPVVFTNYHMLKDNHRNYASAALSFLPNKPVFFDSKNKLREELGRSYLRFILKQPALRWAWYLALISLILFMFFNAKRKQRVVKVIKPLDNTTIAFAKTIGNLYYETKDHNNLIEKKITYFLEYIRRIYYIDTQLLDEKFAKNLSLKSGKDLTKVQELVRLINYLKAKRQCSENDLIKLNQLIEDFHTS